MTIKIKSSQNSIMPNRTIKKLTATKANKLKKRKKITQSAKQMKKVQNNKEYTKVGKRLASLIPAVHLCK